MKLTEDEKLALDALSVGGTLCFWRAKEPSWREGDRRDTRIGKIVVVDVVRIRVETVKVKDIRKAGRTMTELLQEIGRGSLVWEVRIRRANQPHEIRLLAPSGRRSGDYTSNPGRAMPREPEAINDEDLLRMASQGQRDREQLIEQFQARVAQEARELFRGSDALRNFERVLDTLAEDKPTKKRRAG